MAIGGLMAVTPLTFPLGTLYSYHPALVAGLPEGCRPSQQLSAPGLVTLRSGSRVSKPGTAFRVATLPWLWKMLTNSGGTMLLSPLLHTWANPSVWLARGDE